MSDENDGWALLTGASGGIGRVFAKALAKRGFKTIVVARNASKLEVLAEEIRGEGAVCEVVAADLSIREGLELVVARANELGFVEILVNNAGLSRTGSFLDQSAVDDGAMLRLNIDAIATLTRAFLPSMVERDKGGVIHIASVVGFQPVPYWTTYAATKAFVLAFGQGLSRELRNSKTRVVTVCPGFTRTGLYDKTGVPGLAGKILPFSTPEIVVKTALKAYDRGRVIAVVGWLNWLFTTLGRLQPRSIERWIMGHLFVPRSS
ncbi:MAG: SDR family oxidoreductase [Planctomycetota bacterium]|nr:SDR family oxidoreductase [Planctomycetota bacterium]